MRKQFPRKRNQKYPTQWEKKQKQKSNRDDNRDERTRTLNRGAGRNVVLAMRHVRGRQNAKRSFSFLSYGSRKDCELVQSAAYFRKIHDGHKGKEQEDVLRFAARHKLDKTWKH